MHFEYLSRVPKVEKTKKKREEKKLTKYRNVNNYNINYSNEQELFPLHYNQTRSTTTRKPSMQSLKGRP